MGDGGNDKVRVSKLGVPSHLWASPGAGHTVNIICSFVEAEKKPLTEVLYTKSRAPCVDRQHQAVDKSSSLSILSGCGIGRVDSPHGSNISLSRGQGAEALSALIRKNVP